MIKQDNYAASLAGFAFFDDMAILKPYMRLLVIGMDRMVADPSSGSAQRQAGYYQGWDVDILVIAPGEPKTLEIASGIRVIVSGGKNRARAFFAAIQKVRQLCRSGQYDVVTVQDPFFSGWLGLIATWCNPKTKLHLQDHSEYFVRNFRTRQEKLWLPLALFLIRWTSRIRTVSQRGARGLEARGIPAEQIDVIPVATDFSRFTAIAPPSNALHVLCVARLEWQKGIDVLLKAWSTVRKASPEAKLKIVGDGSLRASLEHLAKEQGLADSVEFMGHQADVISQIEWSSMVVQPSRFEGWGLAAVEAAAAQRPVIMTETGAAGEIFIDQKSALIVPMENPEALAAAILKLQKNPQIAQKHAAEAKRRVQALPTPEATTALIRQSLEKTTQDKAWPSLKEYVRLYGISWLVRIAVFVLVLYRFGQDGLIFPDSKSYLGLANSLVSGQGFMHEGIVFAYRTIGYPLFLAGALFLKIPLWLIAIFQISIASLVPVLALRISKSLGFSKRVCLITAWICALEPQLVFFSFPLLTEWIMFPLALLAIDFLLKAFRSGYWRDVTGAGVVHGIGLLIKPVYQAFPVFLIIGLLSQPRFRSSKKAWIKLIVGLGIAFAIIFPWLLRSKIVFNAWDLSSQGRSATLFYLGTSIIATSQKIPYGEAEVIIRKRFMTRFGADTRDHVGGGKEYTTMAWEIVREHPGTLAKLILTNTVSFWTAHTYNYVPYYYKLIPQIDWSVLPPTHYLIQGRFQDFFRSFGHIFTQPFYYIGVIGRLMWATITLLMLAGWWLAWRRLPREGLLLVIGTCIYVTVTLWVNGLGVDGRLRLPIVPFQILFAVFTLEILWEWRQKKHRTKL